MKILKESGSYLKRKVLQNVILLGLCIFIFIYVSVTSIHSSPLYVDVGRYEGVRALLLVFPLLFGVYFFRQTIRYVSGLKGEVQVTKVLSSSLGDEYCLINDVNLPAGYGNIDHIVVAPNGLFVIETKNNRGKIKCYGDHWTWQYRHVKRTSPFRWIDFELGSSPSKQVKSNVMRLKKALQSTDTTKPFDTWIYGVVVFSNPDIFLDIINPPPNVDILKIQDLPTYIKTRKYRNNFSQKEIELISKEILRQDKTNDKRPQQ